MAVGVKPPPTEQRSASARTRTRSGHATNLRCNAVGTFRRCCRRRNAVGMNFSPPRDRRHRTLRRSRVSRPAALFRRLAGHTFRTVQERVRHWNSRHPSTTTPPRCRRGLDPDHHPAAAASAWHLTWRSGSSPLLQNSVPHRPGHEPDRATPQTSGVMPPVRIRRRHRIGGIEHAADHGSAGPRRCFAGWPVMRSGPCRNAGGT